MLSGGISARTARLNGTSSMAIRGDAQILSDESGRRSGAREVAGEARPGQRKSSQASAKRRRAGSLEPSNFRRPPPRGRPVERTGAPTHEQGERSPVAVRKKCRRQATNETSSREVGFCVENQNLGDRGRTRQRAPCAQNRMPTARDLRPIDSACHARTVPRRPPPFQRSEANPARACWRHCGRAPQPRARSAPAAT